MKVAGHAGLGQGTPAEVHKGKGAVCQLCPALGEVGHQQLVQGVWQAEGQASGPPAGRGSWLGQPFACAHRGGGMVRACRACMHMWPAAAQAALQSSLMQADQCAWKSAAAQTQPWEATVRGGDVPAAKCSTHHLAFLWCSHCTLSLLLSTVSTHVNLLPGQVPGLRHASSWQGPL